MVHYCMVPMIEKDQGKGPRARHKWQIVSGRNWIDTDRPRTVDCGLWTVGERHVRATKGLGVAVGHLEDPWGHGMME